MCHIEIYTIALFGHLEYMFHSEDRCKQHRMTLKEPILLFGNVRSLLSPENTGKPFLHMIRIACAGILMVIGLS